MANKLLKGFQNTKARTLLLLGVFILIVIAIAFYFLTQKSTPLGTEASKAGKVPLITAIPGGVTSERYQELQEAENRKRAEQAKRSGGSEVATIIGSRAKEGLASKERFGIEDMLAKQCTCPPSGVCTPEVAQDLTAQIAADPNKTLAILKANPCMKGELCKQPQLALKAIDNDEEIAKLILSECPDNTELVQALAASNPELFKKLMINNPELARKIAAANPALIKKLMLEDPAFARAMALNNPALVKQLMLDDPAFAKQMADKYPDILQKLMQDDPEFAKKFAEKYPAIASAMAAAQAAAQEALRKKQAQLVPAGQVSPQAAAQLSEIQQRQLQDLTTAMEGQAKTAFQAWNEFNPQQFVQGEWANKKEKEEKEKAKAISEGKAGGEGKAGEGAPSILFKAGTVVFAVLDTSICSDEPGPILATVVEGKYRGARLLGTFTAAPQPGGLPPKAVTLNFTSMSIPAFPKSVSVQAVAVDPDTDRTALASDVDRHILKRYGSILASSFLVGYAKVITSQGSVQTTAANGMATTTTAASLSGQKQIYAALGEVGKKLGDSWKGYADMPPTITVDSGTGIGILFLTDVSG